MKHRLRVVAVDNENAHKGACALLSRKPTTSLYAVVLAMQHALQNAHGSACCVIKGGVAADSCLYSFHGLPSKALRDACSTTCKDGHLDYSMHKSSST
jgi:hypothetical protein